jgi:polyhydroxyalkanoate synthase
MVSSDRPTLSSTNPFSVLDHTRRLQGRLLEAAGWAPVQTDSDVLFSQPGVRVRSYQPAGDGQPPVLLVPAPIKRAYIWDLEPSRSPVRVLLEAGFAVHLLEWVDPGPEETTLGLGDYVDGLLLAAVNAVTSATGDMPAILAHSVGGTFAALFAALHPDLVRGLALLEAPLRFGAGSGAFAPLVAVAPHTAWVRSAFGNVPGSFISTVSGIAAPATFHVERYVDLLANLGQAALHTHMRVQRWTLDEMAMPGQLFEDIVEHLYRRDRFMRSELLLGGRRIGPNLVRCPLLAVVNPTSRIIPPQSVVPFHDAAASPRKVLLRYEGDRGVALQHVGVLVGAGAHARLWPEIVNWLGELGR